MRRSLISRAQKPALTRREEEKDAHCIIDESMSCANRVKLASHKNRHLCADFEFTWKDTKYRC